MIFWNRWEEQMMDITHFLLPDTSVPMEPNPLTTQMEATYTSETSELTYIKQTSNCEVSFSV